MAIAAHRCDELLSQNNAITLWRLPQTLEDRFESHWETRLDRHADWCFFFEAVAAIRTGDVIAATSDLELFTNDEIKAIGAFRAERRQIANLALGFSVGRANDPVVPFVQESAL